MLTGRRDVVDLSPFSQVTAQVKSKCSDLGATKGRRRKNGIVLIYLS